MSSHKNVRLGPHVSRSQRELLVAFMEEHAYLVTTSRVPSAEVTAERKSELWEQITAALNAEGPSKKSVRGMAGFLAQGGVSIPPSCRRKRPQVNIGAEHLQQADSQTQSPLDERTPGPSSAETNYNGCLTNEPTAG
ncbi:hypothetical protein HPB49_001618 [Dermacentor silvarum]|uniref:Uncharacterized protein n=1 Tax=Dermacentor silvarum TaxID=543639 RepID=A0ACB8DI36_DERSI|nr:hypothetical protein HPB49_001618 [Dermacentor silvarum]